ncbi:MAG TPA: cyclic nucleotide-binding domain-containing protein, partial [Gemmatimonadales bacterium]
MASLIALANSTPPRALVPMEILINQGASGGNLYVLQSGELAVERDGVEVARVSRPYALVGEMSVLLGTPNS